MNLTVSSEKSTFSIASRFMHSKTAAQRPLPIERASKSDLVAILAVYQHQYSNTNSTMTLSIISTKSDFVDVRNVI